MIRQSHYIKRRTHLGKGAIGPDDPPMPPPIAARVRFGFKREQRNNAAAKSPGRFLCLEGNRVEEIRCRHFVHRDGGLHESLWLACIAIGVAKELYLFSVALGDLIVGVGGIKALEKEQKRAKTSMKLTRIPRRPKKLDTAIFTRFLHSKLFRCVLQYKDPTLNK